MIKCEYLLRPKVLEDSDIIWFVPVGIHFVSVCSNRKIPDEVKQNMRERG